MYPLVYGLTSLMKVTEEGVEWITDPDEFVKQNMNTIMKSFYAMIVGVGFDPAKVGKSGGAYNLACDLYSAATRTSCCASTGWSDPHGSRRQAGIQIIDLDECSQNLAAAEYRPRRSMIAGANGVLEGAGCESKRSSEGEFEKWLDALHQ